jgi:hypothetical protein
MNRECTDTAVVVGELFLRLADATIELDHIGILRRCPWTL